MITKYEKANKGKLLVAVLALFVVLAGAAVVFSDSDVNADQSTLPELENGKYTLIGDTTLSDAVTLTDVTLDLAGFNLTVPSIVMNGSEITDSKWTSESTNKITLTTNISINSGKSNSISNVNIETNATTSYTVAVSYGISASFDNVVFAGTNPTAIYYCVNGTSSTVSVNNCDLGGKLINYDANDASAAGYAQVTNSTDVSFGLLNNSGKKMEFTVGEQFSATGTTVDTVMIGYTDQSDSTLVVPSGESLNCKEVVSGSEDGKNAFIVVEDGGYFNATTNSLPGNNITNSNPQTGLDQSIIAVENDDLTFSGDVYLAGNLSIPEDKTLTFRSGSTLNLNGKTLTVNGTLVIESGAEVFGFGNETIVLGSTGSIQNSGVIGYGSEVKVAPVTAGASNYVTMMNVEGVSFGIETVYTGSTPAYTLTVSGDVYATSGDFSTYTIDIVGAKIVGEFTTASEVTADANDAIITKDAVYNVEGVLTGSIVMTDGSSMNITGNATAAIKAQTGNFLTADKSADGFQYATSQVTLEDVTDIALSIGSSTYTEDKKNMTEQVLYISGTASYVGDATSGTITIVNTDATYNTSVTNPAVTKIAGGAILAVDSKTTINGGGIIVLGQIQTNGDGSNVKSFVGTKYTVSDASDKTKKTTYITTFNAALAAIDSADKKTVTVYGEVEIAEGFTLTDGQTIVLSESDIKADVTIGSDANVTVNKGAKIDGAVSEVQGILFVQKGGVVDEPLKYAVYGNNKETGDKTYAGLEAAIANSAAGDVITVVGKGYESDPAGVPVKNALTIPADRTVVIDNGKTVTFEKDLTIDEGATLTNKGTIAMNGEKAKITVNGVLDNSAMVGTTFAKEGGNINANGQYIVSAASALQSLDYSVNGAYYVSQGKTIVTTFAKAAVATGEVEGAQSITVIGKISESGAVTVDTDTVTVSGTASLGDITIVDTSITVQSGELTANIVGAYGADGSTTNATLSLSKATSIVVTNDSAVDDMNVTTWFNSINGVSGGVTVASGEFQISTENNTVALSEDDYINVASGATLVIPTGETIKTGGQYLTVAGTISVLGTLEINADTAIAGSVDVKGTFSVDESKTLTVTGTVSVSADEEDNASFTVNGRLNVGAVPGTLGAATGSINGTVTVVGQVVVYTGASVADAKLVDNAGNDLKSTAFVINDIAYATAYGDAHIDMLNEEILKLKDLKDEQTITWYADGNEITNPNNVAIGTYDEVTTTLAWADVGITISAGPGLEIYIDNVKMNGDTHLAVGEHNVTVYVKSGYEGTPEITFNGQTITDGKFILTSDMVGESNVLFATGATPIDYTQGGSTGGDSGMGLVEILLIILVVVVVILAIIVVLRMMRS